MSNCISKIAYILLENSSRRETVTKIEVFVKYVKFSEKINILIVSKSHRKITFKEKILLFEN